MLGRYTYTVVQSRRRISQKYNDWPKIATVPLPPSYNASLKTFLRTSSGLKNLDRKSKAPAGRGAVALGPLNGARRASQLSLPGPAAAAEDPPAA